MSTNSLSDSNVQELRTIEQSLLNDYSPQVVALSYHLSGRASTYEVLKDTADEIKIDFDDSEDFYRYGNSIHDHLYIVADDDTSDKLWEDDLDSYIDECILDELPEKLRFYFDRELWMRDAKMDGRGHSLGRYYSHEHCEIVDGTDYFIYRQE